MDGHALEEVAKLLHVPVGTVKSRLHSARKQLAEKLR
jgi:DNA-directed RNA polymerase specialized sigma24 family protein